MALDYTSDTATTTGLFVLLGKVIKYVNSRLAAATTSLVAELKAVADLYEKADDTDIVAGLYGAYDGFRRAVVAERQALAAYCDATLLDRDRVLTQVGDVQPSLDEILLALYRQMRADLQAVKKCVVTVGAASPAGGNQGNGTILVTKVLDGYNAPLADGLANPLYRGVDSELAATSETMTLTCIADSNRDSLGEGAEEFDWHGGLGGDRLDYLSEGSGQGPGLTVCNEGGNLLADGSFEGWSGNTPSSWTVTDGTAGTHVFREQAAGYAYRGTSSLRITGDGSQATIGVEQELPVSSLNAGRMYCVPVRIRASAVPASGTIGVRLSSSTYASAGSEEVSVAAGSFPASGWALYHFFVIMPGVIPDDLVLQVRVTGTLSAGVSVWFDDAALAEVTYHGGVGAVAVAGSSAFAAGDRFTFTLANDDAGVFSRFFRQWYRFQLPSTDATVGPWGFYALPPPLLLTGPAIISDALAT